jgi:hypothetical protein
MEHTKAEYTQYLNEAFPEEILRSILLAVIDGYKAAPGVVKKMFDIPDRHDVLGIARRGKLHEQLRGVAEFHKLQAKDEPNSNRSSFFLSIISGRYRLVANLVCRKKHMVRPAKIRKLWARHNRDAQSTLGFEPKESPAPGDATFLAILLHGPRGRHRDQPGFVDIVVPDRRFRDYMCRVELLSRFPQIANTMLQRQEMTRREPKERKRRKTDDGRA